MSLSSRLVADNAPLVEARDCGRHERGPSGLMEMPELQVALFFNSLGQAG